MRLYQHVLPPRLRPVLAVVTAVIAALIAVCCTWALTSAWSEHARRERLEQILQARYLTSEDHGIEAACSVVHLLAPAHRQQLAEFCVQFRAGAPR